SVDKPAGVFSPRLGLFCVKLRCTAKRIEHALGPLPFSLLVGPKFDRVLMRYSFDDSTAYQISFIKVVVHMHANGQTVDPLMDLL
ncbi:hypothetical protein AVEN_120317-1, partial [Araneus ventricosus]